MPEISEEKEKQFNILKIILKLSDEDNRLKYVSGPAELGRLRATDIAVFNYRRKAFMVLCVLNQRTGSQEPFFTNTRTGNQLLSCFRIDGTSVETLEVILNSLYTVDKNTLRKIASYRYFKNMFSLLLGKRQYRTFNKLEISGVSRYTLQ